MPPETDDVDAQFEPDVDDQFVPDVDAQFEPDAPVAAALAPADKTGTGKVYNPNKDITETRVGYKLVGPSEQGDTTGAEPEATEPAWNPVTKKPSVGFMEAILRKFGKGGFSGYADEAAGVLGTKLPNDPGQYKVLPDGTEVPARDDVEQYRAERDTERQYDDAADKKLGKWGMVPQAAGSAAQYVAGGPVWDKIGGKVLGKLAPQAANYGKIRQLANVAGANALAPAALGSFGNSESDLTKGEALGSLGETALGTVMETGTAGALGGVTGAANEVADATGFTNWIKGRAQKNLDSARSNRDDWFFRMLNTKKGDFKKMDHLDNEGDISQYAFDKGMVGKTTTPKSIAEVAAANKGTAGDAIGSALTEADVVARPDQLPSDANTLRQLYAMRDEYAKSSGGQKMLPKIQTEIDNIEAAINARNVGGQGPADPRVTFGANETNKTLYDQTLDWGDDKFAQKAAKDARTGFKTETEQKLAGVDPALAEKFNAAKSDFGNAASIEALASDAVAGEKARNTVGLGTKVIGAGGLMSLIGSGLAGSPAATMSSLAGTAAVAGGHHLAQKFGPAYMATRANNLMSEYAGTAANGIDFQGIAKALAGPTGREVGQEEVQAFLNWLQTQK